MNQRYKEFGETTIVDGSFAKLTRHNSAVQNGSRYTGRSHIVPDGQGDDWYYYRARLMRPEVGRFLQRDPLSYIDASNQYIYVSNRPVQRNDPAGELSLDPSASADLCAHNSVTNSTGNDVTLHMDLGGGKDPQWDFPSGFTLASSQSGVCEVDGVTANCGGGNYYFDLDFGLFDEHYTNCEVTCQGDTPKMMCDCPPGPSTWKLDGRTLPMPYAGQEKCEVSGDPIGGDPPGS